MALPHLQPRALASAGTVAAFGLMGAFELAPEEWHKVGVAIAVLLGMAVQIWRTHLDIGGVGHAARSKDQEQQRQLDELELRMARMEGRVEAVLAMMVEHKA